MATEPMRMTRLRNGIEEPAPVVVATYRELKNMADNGKAIAVYELVELCRNREHTPWGNTGDDLVAHGLARCVDGKWWVHDSIRNIVLACAEGDEENMIIQNPVAS